MNRQKAVFCLVVAIVAGLFLASPLAACGRRPPRSILTENNAGPALLWPAVA